MNRDPRATAWALIAVLGLCGCGAELPQVERVLLISIDTLRPDYLGCYSPGKDTTPHLDRFAADGTLFTNVLSNAPSTTISHKSLLYSLYPAVHKTTRISVPEEDVVSPVESLRREGFITAAITARGGLAPELGFERGFDSYFRLPRLKTGRQLETLHRESLRWLEEHADEKFFLFLHAYQPHCPYTPPEPYAEKYAGWYTGDVDPVDHCGAYYNTREMSEEDYRYLRALYSGEVSYVDWYLGELFDTLKRLDLYNGTMVVFTSDHGDSLGERGFVGHNRLLHVQLRVPLIVKLPGVAPARIDAPLESIDVMPTIFAALDLEPPYDFQGTNLIPLMQGRSTVSDERLRVANQGSATSLHEGAWHLILDEPDVGPQLYRFRDDPEEIENLASRFPAVVVGLREAYRRLLGNSRELSGRFVLPDDRPPELGEETVEDLKALGYVQ